MNCVIWTKGIEAQSDGSYDDIYELFTMRLIDAVNMTLLGWMKA